MKDDEKLIENEDDLTRDSNVKMGRISDVTLEKIENIKETQSQEGKKKKNSINSNCIFYLEHNDRLIYS